MPSAFAQPLLIRANRATPLDRVPLSGRDSSDLYSESWLQDLLFHYPQSLPIADIDDSFLGLIPLCREMNTPVGPIDVFYITPTGRPVIVEAKLWRNPEARRKVIGQILDYAKELARFSFDNLDAAVRSARRTSEKEALPSGIIDIVKREQPELDEPRFTDSVARNLRRGNLLLLVVGDGVHEGAGAIADFLESHGTLQFTFGLVEMAIYRFADEALLVQPRIIAQSEIFKRIVVDVRHDSIVAEQAEEVEEAHSEPEITEEMLQNRRRFQSFWTAFLDELQLDDKSQPVRQPSSSQNQYFAMPRGSHSTMSAYLVPSQRRAGVFLTFERGPTGDKNYDALLTDRAAIEEALGKPLEWKSDGQKHYIKVDQRYVKAVPEEHATEIRKFLADYLNRFVNVFKPRLERLARDS